MHATSVKVWDLPLRLFHWLLVISVAVAYCSTKTDWLTTDVHWYAGMSITFLWLFRVIWGFVGSATAQFRQFFPTPSRLLHSMRHGWQQIGHTPTGGLSVIALLLLLAAMIVTGLFASDDIALNGPIAPYVDESFSDQMSAWHAWLFKGLLSLIALHIAAIAYYLIYKKNNLLQPMITGVKTVSLSVLARLPRANQRLGWRLLGSLLLASLLTWAIFSPTAHHFFYQPPPAIPTPAAAW